MGTTLTRADLVDALHAEIAPSRGEAFARHDCAEVLETVLSLISDALVAGDTVKLSTFGAFSVREKGERVGRNPRTGEEVAIAPRRVLVFKPSHVLKERVDAALSE